MMELIFDTEYTDGAKTEDEASPSPSKGEDVFPPQSSFFLIQKFKIKV